MPRRHLARHLLVGESALGHDHPVEDDLVRVRVRVRAGARVRVRVRVRAGARVRVAAVLGVSARVSARVRAGRTEVKKGLGLWLGLELGRG